MLGMIMPLTIIKNVWKYCIYNKKFFLLILFFMFVISYIQDEVIPDVNYFQAAGLSIVTLILSLGYGMQITNDKINKGTRLPKINLKKLFYLGIKATFITLFFYAIQDIAFSLISAPLNFPDFDLGDLLLNLPETLSLLYSHSPRDSIIFICAGSVVFYVLTIFYELSLAKIADNKSIFESLNVISSVRCIQSIGWKKCIFHLTLIILVMVLFGCLQYISVDKGIFDYIFSIFSFLLIFVTQFWGIGAIYSDIKDEMSN